MCLKGMQLSLKNMARGGGGMGEMNDKNEDKQYSASRVWFRKHTVLCNSVTWVHYVNSNNILNAQILLSSLLLFVSTELYFYFRWGQAHNQFEKIKRRNIQIQGVVEMSEIANRNYTFDIHSTHSRNITN